MQGGNTMNEGWLCPRCSKINAPFVSQCNCVPDRISVKLPDTGSYTTAVPENFTKQPDNTTHRGDIRG